MPTVIEKIDKLEYGAIIKYLYILYIIEIKVKSDLRRNSLMVNALDMRLWKTGLHDSIEVNFLFKMRRDH